MKTIDEIVEQLRSENNLDEEALARFEKKNKKQKIFMKVLGRILVILCCLSIIRSDIGTFLSSMILFIYGYCYIYKPIFSDVVKYVNLYNNGIKSTGKIIQYNKIYWPKSIGPFVHEIRYCFSESNKTYTSNDKYPYDFIEINEEEFIKEKKIEVLFDRNKTNNSCIYNKKLEEKFKLRKS